jgi:phosphomannomutase
MRSVARRIPTGPTIDISIFKSYDIRGIVPDQLNTEVARLVGRVFRSELPGPVVAVGRDMRVHSDELTDALCEGLVAGGCTVLDVGRVSTDALYFAVGHLQTDGGIMVTASHNPPEYNGFKMCRRGAEPLSGRDGINRIAEMISLGDVDEPTAEGRIEKRDILPAFTEHVLSFIDRAKIRPFKIVIDAGNGMAGITVPRVFAHLPCQVIPLYMELDGRFPNHPANPIEPENLKDLQERVLAERADFGVAFDGDADRMFLIDENAKPISGDIVTLLVAKSLLAKNPGATILYNIICSRAVSEGIMAAGGRAVRTPVGHALIKPMMKKENAIFGGEHSGHFYFQKNWYADSGLIALLVAMEVMSESDKSLSQLVHSLDPYFRSGEINSKVTSIPKTLQKIEAAFPDRLIDRLDGITIQAEDWWFNVRPSNTEPLLRLNVEAKSADLLNEKTEEVLRLIRGRKRTAPDTTKPKGKVKAKA